MQQIMFVPATLFCLSDFKSIIYGIRIMLIMRYDSSKYADENKRRV